jgi:hypothetical protein
MPLNCIVRLLFGASAREEKTCYSAFDNIREQLDLVALGLGSVLIQLSRAFPSTFPVPRTAICTIKAKFALRKIRSRAAIVTNTVLSLVF